MAVSADEVRELAASLPRSYEVLVRGRVKFRMPSASDLRFNWIHVNLAAIDRNEMRDLVEDAWARAVPKFVAEHYATARGYVR